MKKTGKKISSYVAALALSVASANVNSCCMYVMHQPQMPKGAEKLKKH